MVVEVLLFVHYLSLNGQFLMIAILSLVWVLRLKIDLSLGVRVEFNYFVSWFGLNFRHWNNDYLVV